MFIARTTAWAALQNFVLAMFQLVDGGLCKLAQRIIEKSSADLAGDKKALQQSAVDKNCHWDCPTRRRISYSYQLGKLLVDSTVSPQRCDLSQDRFNRIDRNGCAIAGEIGITLKPFIAPPLSSHGRVAGLSGSTVRGHGSDNSSSAARYNLSRSSSVNPCEPERSAPLTAVGHPSVNLADS